MVEQIKLVFGTGYPPLASATLHYRRALGPCKNKSTSSETLLHTLDSAGFDESLVLLVLRSLFHFTVVVNPVWLSHVVLSVST